MADAIENAAKAALLEFTSIPEIRDLNPGVKDLVSKMFVKNVVMLNVASKCDPEKAQNLSDVAQKVLDRIWPEEEPTRPHLRLIK